MKGIDVSKHNGKINWGAVKADYAVSTAFAPYAPTNRELYEMILAMQS